jgi:hypothetical protein
MEPEILSMYGAEADFNHYRQPAADGAGGGCRQNPTDQFYQKTPEAATKNNLNATGFPVFCGKVW